MDALPQDLPAALRRRAERGAEWIREQQAAGRTITIIHHIDADGVTSGAIAAETLARLGVAHILQPVKSLDDVHIKLIQDLAPEALWFCDLGSTAYMHFDVPRLVCDHHQLVRDGHEESFAHVNPLLDGLSGEEISGAGCAYLVSAAMGANVDLLPLALVGAAADLQDRRQGRFVGANAALLEQGLRLGLLSARTDVSWFGTESRPLRKFLGLATGPAIPTMTGDGRTAEAALLQLGIGLTGPDGEPTWARLSPAEQTRLRGAFVERLIATGLADRIPRLWRQVVNIAEEAPGPTRELQEFGTLLNSTARYGRPEIGLAVARGDRVQAYAVARDLLLDHRKHLAGALDAMSQAPLRELAAIQWVHLQDRVLDTVVGIVCGMALDGLGLRKDRVLVGLAWTPDGRTKTSARAPHEMVTRGVDLAVAQREAAASVGGQGGGHPGAAGATIPRSAEATYLAALDALVLRQVGSVTAPVQVLQRK